MPEVTIKGLKQLDKALGKADTNLRKNLRDELKGIANIVAVDARGIAAQRNKKVTGNLVSRISPYALTGKAGVRSTAVHNGYPYPNRLEYEGRTGKAYGPRASLNPALERNLDKLNAETEKLMDNLLKDFES